VNSSPSNRSHTRILSTAPSRLSRPQPASRLNLSSTPRASTNALFSLSTARVSNKKPMTKRPNSLGGQWTNGKNTAGSGSKPPASLVKTQSDPDGGGNKDRSPSIEILDVTELKTPKPNRRKMVATQPRTVNGGAPSLAGANQAKSNGIQKEQRDSTALASTKGDSAGGGSTPTSATHSRLFFASVRPQSSASSNQLKSTASRLNRFPPLALS